MWIMFYVDYVRYAQTYVDYAEFYGHLSSFACRPSPAVLA